MKKPAALLCILALALPLAGIAAEAFPSKPLTLVVPFPPGGPSDALARQVAQRAGTRLGLYRALQYAPSKDFEPVAHLGSAPLVLIAHPALPVKTFAEFVDYARKNTAKLHYGSAGAGSISHLGCLVLMSEMKTDVQHIPYKGVAPAMADLLGGQIEFMCDQTTTALPQVRSGKLKAIAALVSTRIPVMADLPTAAEGGFPGVNVR
ncbi:MAG: tripartite tricarboxylate transporter substrate-binding protein, partial [Proteobacteria bacterium]|nr:tripartite tricarboxylate transporter substrate-binding protein [Pseudomonadota bacterium]